MPQQEPGALAEFGERFADYLPSLAAGLFVLALGILVGWVAKRAVVRILTWLRLDRLGRAVGWRAAFRKGDIREGLYNVAGTVAMVLIVLVFLENSVEILGLKVLSDLLARLVFYLPNMGLVALIVAIGVLLSNLLADRVQDALEDEEFARARLVSRLLKGSLLFVVGALALWQLNFARQIVLSGFLIAFGAMGAAFALAVGLGAHRAIQKGVEALFEKRKND